LKLLVLGSEGFIGSHCVTHFLSRGHEVAGADLFEQPTQQYEYRRISRLSQEMDEWLKEKSFEAVINAAGSANVPFSMTHPVLDFESNCLDTLQVLDGIRQQQPACRYLHISSAAVYGNPLRLPVAEEDQAMPLSPYGWHKLMGELLCREYTSIYGLRTAIVRPFSVYGPGLRKQMFWDLYQKTKAGGPIQLIGTGKESRDYIHINDVVLAFELILQKSEMKGEIYNIASGEEVTIEKVVRIYFDALSAGNGYTFNGIVRKGDPLNWQANVNKLSKLGFTCKTNLTDGLQQLSKWIKAF
jgi:nucleoside-diphosphate-sugar epimerase